MSDPTPTVKHLHFVTKKIFERWAGAGAGKRKSAKELSMAMLLGVANLCIATLQQQGSGIPCWDEEPVGLRTDGSYSVAADGTWQGFLQHSSGGRWAPLPPVGCEHFWAHPAHCYQYKWLTAEPRAVCCSCGGGNTTAPPPPVPPAPPVPPPSTPPPGAPCFDYVDYPPASWHLIECLTLDGSCNCARPASCPLCCRSSDLSPLASA